MKIFIPKKIIHSSDEINDANDNIYLTNYELLVYCYLKFFMPVITAEHSTYYLHVKTLLYNMFDTLDISIRMKENINRAIKGLIEKSIITASKQQNSLYMINSNSLKVNCAKEKYIVLDYADIQRIVLSDHKCRFQVLRYYLCLLTTINTTISVRLDTGNKKSNVVGYQTQLYLATIANVSPATVIRFNRILEDLKLVYICRSGDFKLINGSLSRIPNVYGRYCDKEYIQKYANEYSKYENGYRAVYEKNATSNHKRGLAMKYSWLCRGRKYPLAEVQEIYDYIIQANKTYQQLYETEDNPAYLDKIKDLKIFDNYAIRKVGENSDK